MTTAAEWTQRAIILRDAATRSEDKAKLLLNEAKGFKEIAEACIAEASKLEEKPC